METLDAFDEFARAVRRARGVAQRRTGLTLSQYGLLEPLADLGEARIGALAEAAGITASTATRIFDTMEKRDIVARVRSAGDRRAVSIELTPRGREVLLAHREWVQDRQREFYASLAAPEKAVAASLLTRLADLVELLGVGPP